MYRCTNQFLIALLFLLSSCGQSAKQDKTISGQASNPETTIANPLQEKSSTSNLFTSNDPQVFSAGLTLKGHSFKTGDEIHAVNSQGVRVRFEVTKISANDQPADELKTGEYGFIDLKLLDGNVSKLDGDFYFVDKDAPFPAAQPENPVSDLTEPKVVAKLNDQSWTAAVALQGALYYKGGFKAMDASGKPYLQLAFKSLQAPDDRQLTISIRGFNGKTGVVEKESIEVLLSGSATGSTQNSELVGYKGGKEYEAYSFDLEITQWETVSADKVLLSGKFKGKLKGVFGAKDVTIVDGTLEKIEVKVFSESY